MLHQKERCYITLIYIFLHKKGNIQLSINCFMYIFLNKYFRMNISYLTVHQKSVQIYEKFSLPIHFFFLSWQM